MRCSMWRFSVHIDFLATGLMLQYSFAHGNETEGAQSPQLDGLHRNPVNDRLVGLCQLSGIEIGDTKICGRYCAVHRTRVRSEASLSRRFLQRMDQRRDTDEDCGRLRDLVRGCAVS